MRKGIPIAVILILSLLILIPTNFLSRNLAPNIPLQDLQGASKIFSPLMRWGMGQEILKNLTEKVRDPSVFILAGIVYGEEGDSQKALNLFGQAEQMLPADPLPSLLIKLYSSKKSLDKDTFFLIEQEVKTRLRGWFRDKPLSRLYELRGNILEARKIEARISAYNRALVVRIVFIFFLWIFAFLAGSILLIYFLATRLKEAPPSVYIPSIGWGWSLLYIFLFFFVSTAISSIPVVMLSLPIQSSSFWKNSLPLFILLGELIGGVLVYYLALKRLSRKGWTLMDLGIRVEGFRPILWGFGGWLVAFPLVAIGLLISYLINADAIKSSQDISTFFLSSSPLGKFVIGFLVIAVAPPIEEFLFRGLLYPALREELGPLLGILLSGFFFASIHHDVSRLLPLMALGILFAFLYERRRSLLPSIIAHALWNAQTLVSLYLFFG
ncbi:CPBP family intramembrane metalloprotease [bacterium]|nr:CPBP family intramembrane metalloprotease [bacterium]